MKALAAQIREYALDELRTVDHVMNPTTAQLKAKEQQILSWPIIQAALANIECEEK